MPLRAPWLASVRHGIRYLRRWHETNRQRHLLATLDDASLKDLGLSRADVYRESERSFL
ncbi:DUF1127 domain-containing protein [Pseudomonas sp. RIT-PI-AD]|uniref:DUF1127 domain-containing protein n=1 Tax=Pseudomonas sp. RIT-PI-AD TaxID=3035294 RepID=UPI00320B61C4